MTKPPGTADTAAELKAEYLDQHEEELMQALVTAGALVALSDGRVDAVERDELLNFIGRQELANSISRHEVAEAFDNCVRQLADRDSADVIMQNLTPLAGLSLASVVVRTAERVAAADRQIHPGELQALELIRLILPDAAAHQKATPTISSAVIRWARHERPSVRIGGTDQIPNTVLQYRDRSVCVHWAEDRTR